RLQFLSPGGDLPRNHGPRARRDRHQRACGGERPDGAAHGREGLDLRAPGGRAVVSDNAKSFALALGVGGARALAQVAVIEALDELDLRPVLIAGSSFGALIGAAYAAGMSGKAIRRHVI